jgi:hypothetical protein
MNHSNFQFRSRCFRRNLPLAFMLVGTLMFCPLTMATDAVAPEVSSPPDDDRPGPVGLNVVGASAGITPDYFEQAVTDALVASGIFSDIDNSDAAETIMPMIRAKGVFPGTVEIGNTPYFLAIRIIKLDTPSFSVSMTVGMDAVWTLYRTAGKTELLHEKIHSTYTGGWFEGGIHGANRVRVATEGAARENARMGIVMLEALDLEQEPEVMVSGSEPESTE